MSLKRLEILEKEPISLSEAKGFLRIDHEEENEKILSVCFVMMIEFHQTHDILITFYYNLINSPKNHLKRSSMFFARLNLPLFSLFNTSSTNSGLNSRSNIYSSNKVFRYIIVGLLILIHSFLTKDLCG